jgi:hypothetical protein
VVKQITERCRLPLERAASAFLKLVGVKVAAKKTTQGQALYANQGKFTFTLPEHLFIHKSQLTLASVKQRKDGMYFCTSSGRIELCLTKSQARKASHPGPCDADVRELSQVPAIRRQLQKLDPELLRKELKEYGAWSDDDLADHDANLQRILWIAAGDIHEEANR